MVEQLNKFLSIHREQILRCFEARLEQEHAPDEATRSELRDGMSSYIKLLSQTLGQKDAATTDSYMAFAEEHARQRLRLGFDLGRVVREYGYLYSCILATAKDFGSPLSEPEICELLDRNNLTSSHTITHYTRLRDEQLRQQSARHLSFLAHELRNPLNSAQLAVQLLSSQYDMCRSRAGQTLLRSLARLRDLIDSSLTTGLLEGGTGLERAVLPLPELLAEVAAESDVFARVKDIRIELFVEAGLTVEGDERLLRSAVSNLVRNAIKFTPRGSVAIRARRDGANARIEVEDCCGGLPAGKTALLFQPFVQVGGDRSGFGLGLAIIRQAVRAHDGHVFVSDLPGKGCIFGFSVPLVAAPPAPVSCPHSDERPHSQTAPSQADCGPNNKPDQ